MKVKWTEIRPLHSIPEEYWGEDLSLLDKEYKGDIIGTTKNFWGNTFLTVLCDDGRVRECNIEDAMVVKQILNK
jgi:hypothetical protein